MIIHQPTRTIGEVDTSTLSSFDLDRDPISSFDRWFAHARSRGIASPEAMALATCTPAGAPSVRMVLLRGVDSGGLNFFTNYESRKGLELAANPRASVVLYWEPLGRQIRAEGEVEQLSREASQAYFDTRPMDSRYSAWASHQSAPVAHRDDLLAAASAAKARFGDAVPVPSYWGGYRIVPHTMEFWSAGGARLHDRFLYERNGPGWRVVRLSP